MISKEDKKEVTRFGQCQICSDNSGKYRCPGCDVVSCSLECVRAHKKEAKCDGVRNKSKFVPISKFSELDMLNDYRFLESATRCIENMARDELKRMTRNREDGQNLPPHLLRLRGACHHRGCQIRFLPPHFDRHRANSTKLDFKTRQISWKIQIVFVHSQQIVNLDKIHEKTKLCDIIQPFLEPMNAGDSNLAPKTKRRKLTSDVTVNDEDDIISEDPFSIYKSKGFAKTKLLLKAEGIHRRPRRFYNLDTYKSLVWNLRDKIVVEHPIIYAIFEEHSDYFRNDFDSDDEADERSNEKVGNEHQTQAAKIETDSVEHFSTVSFAGNSEKEEKKEYDKYYDYYFKYFKEKFGVAENSNPEPIPGTSKVPEPKQVPTRPSQPVVSSSKKSSLMLVEYSGSEEDD